MLHFLISLFVIVKGPEDWPDLELEKPNHCGKKRQSPINIKKSEVEEEDSYRRLKITFDNKRGLVTGTFENTGHSPKLIIADSSGASLTGGPLGNNKFELLEFHVHFGCVNERGSEHKLNGKQLSGEVSDNNDVKLFSFTFDSVRYFSFLISWPVISLLRQTIAMVEMITQDGNVYTFPIFSAEPYYSQLRAQCFLE